MTTDEKCKQAEREVGMEIVQKCIQAYIDEKCKQAEREGRCKGACDQCTVFSTGGVRKEIGF